MDLLTTSQVAELLGVTPRHVRNLTLKENLPCRLTDGGHRRFARDEVVEWSEKRKSNQHVEDGVIL